MRMMPFVLAFVIMFSASTTTAQTDQASFEAEGAILVSVDDITTLHTDTTFTGEFAPPLKEVSLPFVAYNSPEGDHVFSFQGRKVVSSWKISEDDRFCRQPNGSSREACTFVYLKLGDEYRVFDAVGKHFETFTVSPGDTEGLK